MFTRSRSIGSSIVMLLLLGSWPAFAQTTTAESVTDDAASAGDAKWFGTLDVKVAQLRLVLDVTTKDGKQEAVMTSLDQGNAVIALDSFSQEGGKMKFAVDKIQASFAGTVSEDGQKVVGKFTQMGATHDLTLVQVDAVPEQKLKAAWVGDLKAGDQTLRMQFRQIISDDGGEVVLCDSLTQHAEGMTTTMKVDGKDITFVVPAVRGKFVGTVSDDGNSIDGEWSQLGSSHPLRLTKKETEEQAPVRVRPQTPKPPFQYKQEDVSFENTQQGHTLAGTLTLPQEGGPFPCVITVSGSGPQDRDETIFGHKPFAVIADHLARQGIATLRYDDRGIGESKGKFAAATTADFAFDAEAAIDFVMADDRIDAGRVGLVGHSEGGMICAIVGARRDDLAHVIMLAGPGVPGDEIIMDQTAAMARAVGASEELVEQQNALLSELVDAAKNELTSEQIEAILEKHPEAAGLTGSEDEPADSSFMSMQLQQFGTPWFKFFLNYDPRPDLRNMKCPTLALVGEKDLQVSVGLNLPEIKAALAASGTTDSRAEELPGLNHLFQPCTTGAVNEYDAIETTLDESVLRKITSWVRAH